MKKTSYMEIAGILSLSLLITSTMAISGGVPEMVNEFCTNDSGMYSRSSIELLVSIPSFTIMLIIALTPVLTKYIRERIMITAGLCIIGTAGMMPVFTSSLPLIFVSRLFLGVGIGLVNTLAVTLIGERFQGELRQKLQGIRCSMETFGEASLIFIAGQLLIFGWHYSFLVYGLAFMILFLYLTFVPETKSHPFNTTSEKQTNYTSSRKLTKREWTTMIQNAVLGSMLVSTLSANALRISSFVVESGFGNSIDGSNILSLSILSGFAGGFLFGKFIQLLKSFLLPCSAAFITVGFVVLVYGGNITAVAIGASICGFFATIALSYMFNTLSDKLPADALTTANSVVLVGCNLGGTITPFLLQAIGLIDSSLKTGFLTYAAAYLILSIGIIFIKQIKK